MWDSLKNIYNILPKFPGISLDGLEQFKNDLRTATFFSWSEEKAEQGKGIFRFQHRSFQEFFLARKISASLSRRNTAPLEISKISNETAEFVLGLLKTKESGDYSLERTAKAIEGVLEESYLPKVSENALILLLKWEELLKEEGPRPGRLCLSKASLSGFTFRSLQIPNSQFDEAELEGCRFMNCDLSGSSFRGAKMLKGKFLDCLLNGVNAEGSQCAGSGWEKVEAKNAVFRKTDLTCSSFLGVDLQGADFGSANFRFASMVQTNMEGAGLQGAVMESAGLAGRGLSLSSLGPGCIGR